MPTTSTDLVPSWLDVTRLAVASVLARYRGPTLTAYTQDLRAFLGWCQTYDREPLRVSRGEPEMYVRRLESRGYGAATVARRFGTVATFYTHRHPPGHASGPPQSRVVVPARVLAGCERKRIAVGPSQCGQV